eukprot:gene17880-biopygen1733
MIRKNGWLTHVELEEIKRRVTTEEEGVIDDRSVGEETVINEIPVTEPEIEPVVTFLERMQRNEDYYAQSSKCADSNGFEGVVPQFFDREEALASVNYGHFFSYDEIESTVKGCPSGKSCGADGVTYEDMKEMFSENGVCKPMVREAVIRQGIEDERRINPCPLQAFADDVVVVSYDVTIINEMFDIGQVAMKIAGLEVKPSKCAVMYARRSGNNWYKGKADKKPTVSIQGNVIEVYPRDKSYKYLGKSLSLSGEDAVQVYEVIESYKDLLEKITSCKLPLALKASALNNLALAKILHHFYNTRFTEEQLELMEKSLVKAVRNIYDLYETTTQLIIFLPREHGGIGVKRVSDVYRSTRVAFLIKMLNHPQLQFKNIARQSLNLDMEKRKVASTDNDMNFLGFEISEDGYLNSRTKFGCQSDWPDLLRYARKLDVSIEFRQGKAGVIINGEFFDEAHGKCRTSDEWM